MKRPKRTVAEISAELIKSLPQHPRHKDFLEAAITLLADDVKNAADPDAPVTEEEALAGARAEFETAVALLAFLPVDDCFHVVWASAAWSRTLKHYVLRAWEAEPGSYGSNPPVSHDPKPKPELH